MIGDHQQAHEHQGSANSVNDHLMGPALELHGIELHQLDRGHAFPLPQDHFAGLDLM
jgi:hypothetical protein